MFVSRNCDRTEFAQCGCGQFSMGSTNSSRIPRPAGGYGALQRPPARHQARTDVTCANGFNDLTNQTPMSAGASPGDTMQLVPTNSVHRHVIPPCQAVEGAFHIREAARVVASADSINHPSGPTTDAPVLPLGALRRITGQFCAASTFCVTPPSAIRCLGTIRLTRPQTRKGRGGIPLGPLTALRVLCRGMHSCTPGSR